MSNTFEERAFEIFKNHCSNEEDNDYASNLIKALIDIISESKEQTMQGLTRNIKQSAEYIVEKSQTSGFLGSRTNLFLKSTASIFQHYINKGLQYYGGDNMEELKQNLKKVGKELLDIASQSKDKIRVNALEFLQNGITILIFGHSTVVADSLIFGANKGIKFSCIVCETRPKCEGYLMYKKLTSHNIPCKFICDSALGTAVEEADLVLVGAEAVVENGGIINRIGTYTAALCAKSLKKQFYVLAESFKFARMFPLSQKDLPEGVKNSQDFDVVGDTYGLKKENINILNPVCDYTPPNLITLLFTDVGIFTPSAVSDELIQIFNN
ncbi:hypothetical protein ABPG74_017258 [Tetrahymena malaccensis]